MPSPVVPDSPSTKTAGFAVETACVALVSARVMGCLLQLASMVDVRTTTAAATCL